MYMANSRATIKKKQVKLKKQKWYNRRYSLNANESSEGGTEELIRHET